MKSRTSRSKNVSLPASRIIIRELEEYLHRTSIRHVHFGDGSTAPPVLAYVTAFPRLSLPLTGRHTMEVSQNGRPETIRPISGHAVFVPENAWNKPDWSAPVEVLTFLFGVKQIGVSLVRHKADTASPLVALKAHVPGGYDVPLRGILASLRVLAADQDRGPLARLLTESLLYACLRLLKTPHKQQQRKATRTYESLCLYVQENFQSAITRKTIADHFGVAPNHISRLFRKEGFMRFNDYLNLVRTHRAKFMLQNYRLTLKEIAFDCGYNDTAYFCRVFKKTCKTTPTEYRARNTAAL